MFPTSISMQLVNRFYTRDLISIDWDHVMLRDWQEHCTDAHDATIVVKINGIEHRREVRIPVIEAGQCRVDVISNRGTACD